MAKPAKSAPAKGDISLPMKGGGGPVQKYKKVLTSLFT
jgi:hypothetical protein